MAAALSTMAVTLAGGHGATAARVSSMSGWLVSVNVNVKYERMAGEW